MYSQNNEQQFIESYFNGKTGTYLEIGVFDATKFSNTYRLLELGWSGVGIEPDPTNFKRITEQYKEWSNISLEQAAFSKDNSPITFYTSQGDGISTTSINHKEKWEKGWKVDYLEITVPCITIQDIFNKHGKQFDFISLDVEGTNWELLQLLPLDQMGTQLICVEYDNNKQEVIDYCAKFGLNNILTQNGENLIIGK